MPREKAKSAAQRQAILQERADAMQVPASDPVLPWHSVKSIERSRARFTAFFESDKALNGGAAFPGHPESVADVLCPNSTGVTVDTIAAFFRFILLGMDAPPKISSVHDHLSHFKLLWREATKQDLAPELCMSIRIFIGSTLSDEFDLDDEHVERPWIDQAGITSLATGFLNDKFPVQWTPMRWQCIAWLNWTVESSLRVGACLRKSQNDNNRCITWGDLRLILHRGEHANAISIAFVTPNGKTEASKGVNVTLYQVPDLRRCPVFWTLVLAESRSALPDNCSVGDMLDPSQRRWADDEVKLSFCAAVAHDAIFLTAPRSFTGRPQVPWTTQSAWYWLTTCGDFLGFDSAITTHLLRHSGSIWMKLSGVEQELVGRQLLHQLGGRPLNDCHL